MAVGLLGFIGVGVESSGGGGSTAWSAAVTDYVPFVSETMAATRADLPDTSIRAQWDEARMYTGQQNVGGNVATIFHPTLTGYFLHTAFDVETVDTVLPQGGALPAGTRAHRFTTKNTQFQAGSGSDLPTLTVEVYRGPTMTTATTNSSFIYYNCTGNNLELDLQAGQLLRCNVDLLGREYGGKTKSAQSFVPAEAYTWNLCSLAVGVGSTTGGGGAIFQGLTVRVENSIQQIAKLDGRLRADLLKRGDFRRIRVNGTLVFQSYSEYDRFAGGSEAQFYMTLAGSGATTPHNWTVAIDVPRVHYSTFAPQIGGPGPLSVAFTGQGMIDPTSNYALEVTVVNTRVSNYMVNTNG